MAMPRAGSRQIVVDGQRYRWYVRRKPTYAQALAETPLAIAVQLAEQPAQVLHVEFDVPRPDAWIPIGALPVTPKVVAAVVRGAIEEGWKPAVRGRTFFIRSSLRETTVVSSPSTDQHHRKVPGERSSRRFTRRRRRGACTASHVERAERWTRVLAAAQLRR